MKSKLRLAIVFLNVLLVIVVTGIAAGMLYDLGDSMSLVLKLIFLIIIIGFPIFVIYGWLCIPKIEVKDDSISSSSIQHEKRVNFEDVKEVKPSKFLNRIYKIGDYYIIQSQDEIAIEIPLKIYSNEVDLTRYVESKITSQDAAATELELYPVKEKLDSTKN